MTPSNRNALEWPRGARAGLLCVLGWWLGIFGVLGVFGDVAAAGPSDLFFRVVDADGRPQGGLRVRLLLRSEDDADLVLFAGSTEVDGTIRVAGPAYARDTAVWSDLARERELIVEVMIATLDVAAVRLDPRQLRDRLLVLSAPSTGSVRAAVEDRRGRPIDAVSVRLLGRRDDGDDWRALDERITGSDGVAFFDHVETAIELMLYAQATDGRWQPAESIGPSPPAAGAEVRYRLHFRDPNTTFWVKLLAADGEPLDRAVVFIDQLVDGKSIVPSRVGMPGAAHATDENGDVEVRLDRACRFAGSFELSFARADPHDTSSRAGPVESARVDVTSLLRPGRVRMETVQLEALAIIAAGQVLSEDGRAIPKAVVTVYEDAGDSLPRRDALGRTSVPHPTEPGRWLTQRFRTKTRADGTFIVRGCTDVDALFVMARRHGLLDAEPRPITRGARGLSFTLPR